MSICVKNWCLAIVALTYWAGEAAARPDMDAGRREFNQTCRSCHSLKHGEVLQGPSLAGVIGRRAGSLEEFNYSDSMQNSSIIWTDETLNTYLASPFMMVVSGIDMNAHGVRDDEDRTKLIEYLKHAL